MLFPKTRRIGRLYFLSAVKPPGILTEASRALPALLFRNRGGRSFTE
jgi:hypothetical protein